MRILSDMRHVLSSFVGLMFVANIAIAQSGPVSGYGSSSGSFYGADRVSELTERRSGGGFSLLDPSKFSMSHSYSMSYFSGSGNSGSIGLYMNTITYQISDPLTLRLGLGYWHQPLGFLNNSGGNSRLSGGKFLPNVSLDYRPSEKFRFLLDFRTVPTYGRNNYTRRSGYGSRSLFGSTYDPWGW